MRGKGCGLTTGALPKGKGNAKVFPPKVLVIGKLEEQDFPEIQSLLNNTAQEVVYLNPSDQSFVANQVAAILEKKRKANIQGQSFDLVLYLQPRKAVSLHVHQQIAAAIKGNSQATCLVQLLGTWCEGEGRTGKVPEAWQRIFWHAWPRWWNRWLVDRFDPKNKTEFGEITIEKTLSNNSSLKLVEAAGDIELTSALRCALLPYGFLVQSRLPDELHLIKDPIQGQIAGIWIGKQLNGLEADSLRHFCNRFQSTTSTKSLSNIAELPVVALLDFPRRETVRAAQAIGASEVVGLPCDADDLVHALEQAIEKSLGKHQATTPTNQYESVYSPTSIQAA